MTTNAPWTLCSATTDPQQAAAWIAIDSYHDGFDSFVDQVAPPLQQRGLFHDDYEGPTLRENLGTHEQYGLDPRPTKPARS